MSRFILNYYLFLLLALVAQAFFTILLGNQNIQNNQLIAKYDLENHLLEQRLDQMQTQVARNRSVVQNHDSDLAAAFDTSINSQTTLYLSLDNLQLLAQN